MIKWEVGRWYFGFKCHLGTRIVFRYIIDIDRPGPCRCPAGFYFYPFNWLRPNARYWGYQAEWYNGPQPGFGFWFFNITWGPL